MSCCHVVLCDVMLRRISVLCCVVLCCGSDRVYSTDVFAVVVCWRVVWHVMDGWWWWWWWWWWWYVVGAIWVQGMSELVKVRPDNPVEWLAKYLLNNNPKKPPKS